MDSISNQQGLTDNSRTHHPIAVEYIFSKTQEIFSRIDHMLDVKEATWNLKGLISYMFSDHSAIKLGINKSNRSGEFTNMGKWNNKLPTQNESK